MSLALACLLLAIPADDAASAQSASFGEFREIARLPFHPTERVVCGDADHDSKPELLARDTGRVRSLYFLEFGPGMTYETTRVDMFNAIAYFLSDLDRDGRTDLVARSADTGWLCVLESADSTSLPRQRVWAAPLGPLSPHAIATDLDIDSAREITRRGGIVYECSGDNRYTPSAVLPDTGRTTGGRGFGSTPDLDRDRLPEVFWVDVGPHVAVYEAVADDSFVLRSVCRIPTPGGSIWCGSVCGAPDIDRNGRTEAIVFALDPSFGGVLAVYESPRDDSFEVVWSTSFPAGNVSDAQRVSVGDVDGDNVPEILVTTGADVLLCRCIGIHQYELFWQCYTGDEVAGLYDLNCDGRAEVICATSGNTTTIYAWMPAGVEERTRAKLQLVAVEPSVVRRSEVVRVAGLPQPAECEVVDASGRVVARLASRVWRPTSSVAGAYFVRIRLGNQTVVRKVLVVE
jgi:hypothetical protein